MPLPDRDFDPTEAAVTWSLIREAGHEVVFATEQGARPEADPIMLSGEGLDPWGFIPGLRRLKLVGLALRARRRARDAYREMQRDESFAAPLRYRDLLVADFDGLVLPGGHGPGMIQYLEDEVLQGFVGEFFEATAGSGKAKPVGAICHGVVLAARATSPRTGRSALHGRKTTALTWRQERLAWQVTRRFARFWDPLYYRTYAEQDGEPDGYRSVESEVKRALADPGDFLDVPAGVADFRAKTGNRRRDTPDDSRPAWVVRDGSFISARWPGDVHTFARGFIELLEESR
ncbi:MAG: type 1 glutamine amidotransferase domain-containing protein [Acidimicrobiales bacterium]